MNFPVSCNDLDCKYNKLVAVGTYKPSVKLFEINKHSMKYERHSINDLIKGKFLEETKFVLLRRDKTLEFHLSTGLYETVKLEGYCRDISVINKQLMICGKKIEILDLEKAVYASQIEIEGEGISINPENGLIGIFNDNTLYFIDSRTNKTVFTKNTSKINCIASKEYLFAIGTNQSVEEFDFRNPEKYNWQKKEKTEVVLYNKNAKLIFAGEHLLIYDDIKIDFNARINCLSCNNDFLFVGGEKEEIETYKFE
ncbi:hypothetical protein NUSPORA_00539 [Nucleospora cyclopteri]